jgi:hypothetical protein
MVWGMGIRLWGNSPQTGDVPMLVKIRPDGCRVNAGVGDPAQNFILSVPIMQNEEVVSLEIIVMSKSNPALCRGCCEVFEGVTRLRARLGVGVPLEGTGVIYYK